jgi:putative DNA primase/helicase
MRSESGSKIREMIEVAKAEVPVTPDQLNRDPWLLNVLNGTIDLQTGELHPHNRDDLITKIAPVEYDPDAKAPVFETFLEKVLPIEALRKFVQRGIGYSLTGEVSEQVLFFLHGSGANGKTTLINAVLGLSGDYGMQAAPDLLVAKGTTHPTELADLFGARFVASTEVEDGAGWPRT